MNLSEKRYHLYKKSCDYLLIHIGDDHNIKSLSKAMGSNHTTLSKVFNDFAGMSPMKWLRTQRLTQARELIIQTRIPLQEIGNQLGFLSSSGFTISYKSFYKKCPSYERKMTTENF